MAANPPESAVIYALATAAVSALVTWLAMRRKMSGSISTTDADRLWSQNEKLIDAYQTDNGHLRDRLAAQDVRMGLQDEKIWKLTERENICMAENAELKRRQERLERMLKVDIGASTEAEFAPEEL
ncbi:MAG: hypothetical protein M3P06_11490 [Acidobacteriota bacterium]|nr:hypothetical protein [Acidobacteriota bacterium]